MDMLGFMGIESSRAASSQPDAQSAGHIQLISKLPSLYQW